MHVTTMSVVIALLFGQIAVSRPPGEEPRLPAEQPHAKVLPAEVALVMLGTYALDKPLATGEREISLSIVDDKLRLRIGEAERLMVYERLSIEETGGVKSADAYGFTVVGMPGVMMQVKVLNNRVQYLVIFDDFAKPPVAATGKPKRRS